MNKDQQIVCGQGPVIRYWAVGLSEDIRLFEEKPVITRGPSWDLICKKHLVECPRMKYLLDVASMSRICILVAEGTFQEVQRDEDVSYEQERKRRRKKRKNI